MELFLVIVSGLTIVLVLALFQQIRRVNRDDERIERLVKDEMSRSRQENQSAAREGRQELGKNIAAFESSLLAQMKTVSDLQEKQFNRFSAQLDKLISENERRLEALRESLEKNLRFLQEENSKKLDQMRQVVDEKLHATLERRLGESFNLISERLEAVYKGLGEMQKLASGVDDLKRVFTNVKTRGTWGEVQLGNLLEQILTSDQYAENVATREGSNDRVEFAIKLPGRDDAGSVVWLPIDAKFPQEDYLRLLDARDKADAGLAEEAVKALEKRIRNEAKNIREKYVDPPHTTDFAILFLPIEGLFAEVLRRPGLAESLQADFRVVVTGPTTLTALLNSLQMGFRTLAIEKRTSDVWKLLGAVKSQFSDFGDLLDKTQKKLKEASNSIENASRKSRVIQRKLRDVTSLSGRESAAMLEEGGEESEPEVSEEEGGKEEEKGENS
ncbi:MAG TPA: DNA recombination protein RmuC [Candidatus Mcinerneyibacteriales bacterium]|nr:DNA recombination protein RmuC [Candidatus Mcinerneyibacteriales bacterium]